MADLNRKGQKDQPGSSEQPHDDPVQIQRHVYLSKQIVYEGEPLTPKADLEARVDFFSNRNRILPQLLQSTRAQECSSYVDKDYNVTVFSDRPLTGMHLEKCVEHLQQQFTRGLFRTRTFQIRACLNENLEAYILALDPDLQTTRIIFSWSSYFSGALLCHISIAHHPRASEQDIAKYRGKDIRVPKFKVKTPPIQEQADDCDEDIRVPNSVEAEKAPIQEQANDRDEDIRVPNSVETEKAPIREQENDRDEDIRVPNSVEAEKAPIRKQPPATGPTTHVAPTAYSSNQVTSSHRSCCCSCGACLKCCSAVTSCLGAFFECACCLCICLGECTK